MLRSYIDDANPCLIRGLPFAEYLALAGAHFSTLKALEVSPLHYVRARDNERVDTASMRLGRITHAAILTPDVPADVAIWDGAVRRGKAWEEFVAAHPGATIVKRDELASAERMRAAVMAHPVAHALLTGGEGEVTMRWTSPEGVTCRARADYLTRDGGLVELKTTRFATPRAFMREAASRLYHAQVAFYSDGLDACGGNALDAYPHVIAVENVEPHDVTVHQFNLDKIDAGRRVVDRWMKTIAQCTASGFWPGAGGSGVVDEPLPAWAMADGLPDVDLNGVEEAEEAA